MKTWLGLLDPLARIDRSVVKLGVGGFLLHLAVVFSISHSAASSRLFRNRWRYQSPLNSRSRVTDLRQRILQGSRGHR
jgi:hypothetical protein